MKNKLLILVFILTLFTLPSVVNAGSFKVSISCSDVQVGATTTCIIYATPTGTRIYSFYGSINVSGGASFVSFSPGSGWQGDGNGGTIDLYTDNAKSGSIIIGSVKLKGVNVGKATITLKNSYIGDSNFEKIELLDENSRPKDVSQSFNVLEKKTTVTTTTTKFTTSTTKNTTTTKPITTNPINPITTVSTTTTTFGVMRLTSVTVDDFKVTYNNGVYYATVKPTTKEVTIGATAPAGITIVGTGKRILADGKNAVDLLLRNEYGQTAIVQLVITKPTDNGEYLAILSSLKVVDYPFAFSSDKHEYSLMVPYNVKEIYVMTKAEDDVIVSGDGLISLNKGKNRIIIKVQYGDFTNEYIIHVNRSYSMILMLSGIGILGVAFIVYIIINSFKNSKKIKKIENKANKALAQANRGDGANYGQELSVNGQNVMGTGRRVVAPARVLESKTPVNQTVLTSSNTVEVIPVNHKDDIVNTNAPKQVEVAKNSAIDSHIGNSINLDNVDTSAIIKNVER